MSDENFVDHLRLRSRQVVAAANITLFDRSNVILSWYFTLLIAGFVVYQAASPIVMGDTDMWYHLAGGRYFWSTGSIPDVPYFSFAAPDREWTAYFWGFQAAIYPVFDAFGYQGLVILRATLFGICLLIVGSYIRLSNERRWSWAAIVLAIAYFVLIDGRAYQLRPHLVSYALIPAFLLILEFRPKLVPALPALTVLWSNTHGVEWVIGAAIVGAYFLEDVIMAARGGVKPSARRLVWMGACLPALLLNPFGWKILTAPFVIPAGLGEFISELQPLSPHAFLNIDIGTAGMSAATILTAFMLLSVAALAHQLTTGRGRISHWILAACGFALLTRGNRFAFEWAFLVLPLVGSLLPAIRLRPPPLSLSLLPVLLALMLMSAPFIILGSKVIGMERDYPFDSEGLPVGIVQFLKQHKATGNLLIAPSYGGYANWELTPAIKIHSDMEFPPFTASDALEVGLVLRGNGTAAKRFNERYPVDFFAAKLKNKKAAREAAKHLGMTPVFFDDAFVLFANLATQPRLASNTLTALDPFNLLNDMGDADAHFAALEAVHVKWPDGRRLNHVLARLLLKRERYPEAKRFATHFATLYPDDPNSHYLLGNIAEQTNHFDEAIEHYYRSMEHADAAFTRTLYRHIGSNHYLNKRFQAAYAAFERGVNIYIHPEDSETLFQFAFSAAATGRFDHAKRLLNALIWSTPDTEKDIINKARTLLDTIES